MSYLSSAFGNLKGDPMTIKECTQRCIAKDIADGWMVSFLAFIKRIEDVQLPVLYVEPNLVLYTQRTQVVFYFL